MSVNFVLATILTSIWTTGVMSGLVFGADDQPGIPEGESPRQTEPSPLAAIGDQLDLIGYHEAMTNFKDKEGRPLTGLGRVVAVIDTGLIHDNVDFDRFRIVQELNLTGDNNGIKTDANDGDGHGSHVAGLIGANGEHSGMARDARFVIVKALHNKREPPNFPRDVNQRLFDALKWIHDNSEKLNISAVNMSISDPRLHISDNFAGGVKDDIRSLVQKLRIKRIPVVVAAGNHFRSGNSSEQLKKFQPGMGFPAIIRETISVGAVYEGEDRAGHDHSIGYLAAKSHSMVLKQIAPFSARIPESIGGMLRTDIFAPGGLLVPSTGIVPGKSSDYKHGGTSQAAPIVTAAILLLQQYYSSHTQRLPTVDDLENWLRSVQYILDGDDEYDNVRHSCEKFPLLDINGALANAQKQIVSQVR